MTNEERKTVLLARWNAPGSKLAIRVMCQMEVCRYTPRETSWRGIFSLNAALAY